MARVTWTAPALEDLERIAEYIAIDKPKAARKLVGSVFSAVDRLSRFPRSGRVPPELSGSIYREVVVSPCRIFYRVQGSTILILHVMRSERQLRRYLLRERDDR
jgi:toxin ParE1/3/4